MTRCDTCGENLDRMEAQSVQTQNGDFCLDCAAREIDRLHKLEPELGRLREFLQEAFPYIPQNIELARKIQAEFGTAEGVNRE